MTDQASRTAISDVSEVAVGHVRAPIQRPENVAARDSAKDNAANQKEPVKWMGLRLPEPIAGVARDIKRTTSRWRTATVKALPAFIVNNSSNILGAAHVATEVAMFKASMKEGTLVQNPENPINWVIQPLTTVFKGVAADAKPKDLNIKELMKGNPLKNIHARTIDTKSATSAEYKRQLKENPHAKVNLSNRWQTRSTFLGLIAWSLSALLPEKKESPDEIERMAIMKINHPLQYAGERMKQALWVPEWHKHKRQMLGLAYVGIGLCSMLGAFRGRKEVDLIKIEEGILKGTRKPSDLTFAKQAVKELQTTLKEMHGVECSPKQMKHVYTFNRDYFMTSLLSLASSFPLLFALDEKSGYSNFGGIMMGRLAFLPGSVRRKYRDGDPGANWYAGSTLSFQVENAMQGLFGGAQKVKRRREDGTVYEEIIDHKDMLQKAKAEAREIKRQHKLEKQAGHSKSEHDTTYVAADSAEHSVPSTHISHAGAVERAMPERTQAETATML